MSNPAASFEPYRRRLLGLAYRMLGSIADAEDAVQETYLRWHAADRDKVSDPRAFLMTTTARICLDMLTSARARREEYVGPWLPEPVVEKADAAAAPRSVSRRPLWSSWWVQGPLWAFLLAAWYLAGFAAGRQIDKVVPRAAPPPRDPYALSLLVLQYGDNIRLTWDRQATPIVLAQRGSLTISDAGQSRTLDLTREQLRNGAVAYHRLSERVQLRLEVSLPNHRSVSETWEFSATGQ